MSRVSGAGGSGRAGHHSWLRRCVSAACVLALAVCAAGCSARYKAAALPSAWTAFPGLADPEPVLAGPGTDVTDAGGTINAPGIQVVVPPGAVPAGHHAKVRTGPALAADPPQRFGIPVGVDHDTPLAQPVTVTWSIPPDAGPHERGTAVLVHWSAADHAWHPLDATLSASGTALTASLTDFSVVDWVSDAAANTGQSVLRLLNARADAPTCRSAALPSWVRQVVAPDEHTPAAAIRFCTEPGEGDVVTARIVDNRSFTQQVTLTPDDQKWAGTRTGKLDASVGGLAYRAAQFVFDGPTRVIVPPLQQIAVDIDRPSTPGQVSQTGTATVTATTVVIDVVSYVLDQMNKAIGKNPLLTAYLQDALECGGDAALSLHASHDMSALLHDVLSVIGGCATQLLEPKSRYGAAFENASRKLIASGGATAKAVVDANRMLYQLSAAYRALQFAEIAFYATDQLANAVVGPLAFSVRGDGRPQRLGAWKPGCMSTAADSNALYRNLALQDAFADTSKQLWQFPQWQPSARTAVAPLSTCGPDFLQQLASYLPAHWGDPRAAAVVATEIRKLTPFPNPPTSASLLAAGLCASPCAITGQVFLNHPGWGPIDVVTVGPSDNGPGAVWILAVDPAGKERWSYRNDSWWALHPDDPATDRTGHLFLVYNPGRYDGVLVLVPTVNGFDDLHTLPAFDDYNERFYSAATADPGRTGTRQVVVSEDDCVPSCGDGTVWSTPYTWNGRDYERPTSPCPPADQLVHGFFAAHSAGGTPQHGRVIGGAVTCQNGWAFADIAFDLPGGSPSDGAMVVAQFADNVWTIQFSGTGALFWGQDPLCDRLPDTIGAKVCVHA